MPWEQMPSVRALAEQLVINPNTVARTYADLIREGVLEAQKGKGVFVARRRAVFTKAERLRRLDAVLEECYDSWKLPSELGVSWSVASREVPVERAGTDAT